ncbi:hypothetical protein DPMN_079692 [Dreissena polymorpha]|uniref:Uncharacterized protein n=1 Tax=Dreissena polymorpha TaxID=45954 RepID=A0A9D3YSM1_DREPO|nr:hypothetical protein DPMN_079692 [Dreissena polymorpha]
MLKLAQTDRPNRQGKNNMSPTTIVRDIKSQQNKNDGLSSCHDDHTLHRNTSSFKAKSSTHLKPPTVVLNEVIIHCTDQALVFIHNIRLQT